MEVGQKLFAARQRRGLTLDDIARTTKIPVALLDAIERDDDARLPQGFFTRGFVRTYAIEAGLDPQDLLHTFDGTDLDVEEVPTIVATNNPVQEPFASRSFVFAMTLAGACAMFYSGYASQLLTRPPAAETPETISSEAIALVVAPCASIAPLPGTIEPERRITTVHRASAAVAQAVPVTHVVSDDRQESTDAAVEARPAVTDAIAPLPDSPPSPATVQ